MSAKHIIIGMGEIGKSLEKVFIESNHEGMDLQTLDIEDKEVTGPVDIMHIAFGWSENFEAVVQAYQKRFKPYATIVYSTVPIGTCKRLNVFHSPVEGRHPELAKSIREMPRWISSNDGRMWLAVGFWESICKEVRTIHSTDFTEFLKLRSTSKFGINLVWTQYEADTAASLGMDFELLKKFDQDYNRLYKTLDMDWAQRYILDPPAGKIGGHCVVPNAELLDKQFPNDLLKMIKEFK